MKSVKLLVATFLILSIAYFILGKTSPYEREVYTISLKNLVLNNVLDSRVFCAKFVDKYVSLQEPFTVYRAVGPGYIHIKITTRVREYSFIDNMDMPFIESLNKTKHKKIGECVYGNSNVSYVYVMEK